MTEEILDGLEGCAVYPSAYRGLQGFGQQPSPRDQDTQGYWRYPRFNVTADTGTLDVILTKESWTRKARRAKLHASNASNASTDDTAPVIQTQPPLLMAHISVSEISEMVDAKSTGEETGLVVKVSWTMGFDAVKFDSFAMFLLAAVERKAAEAVRN